MAVETVASGARTRRRAELTGLDTLDLPGVRGPSLGRRVWAQTWPKLAAVAIGLAGWQLLVASHWRPDYVLPGPGAVLGELAREAGTGEFWGAIMHTMQRALIGFGCAVVIGSLIGVAVARVPALRAAVGSLITGLQTMPSIAWFPLAILFFQLSEQAILFVVVLGAAPSIANGLIAGVDYVPPLLLRQGRSMGAAGLALYRHVVLPASLPSYVSGLKQGWAFAWRSLMAGELIVIVAHRQSIGTRLQFDRDFADAQGLLATMLVILIIGIVVDTVFNAANGVIRRRWGVIDR
jgi:NitT/TauT family transport system permease protein